jgi:hypothetical protein
MTYRLFRLLMTGILLSLLVTTSNYYIATAQKDAEPRSAGVLITGPVPTLGLGLPEQWLARVNAYRSASGLPALTENATFSAALAKHVHYMLLNPTEAGHTEKPELPGYTPEGKQAAAESNLYWYAGPMPPPNPIDTWMGSLFHRYGILNHELLVTGFALGCDQQHCAAGLNVIRGLEAGANPRPDGVTYPGAGQGRVNTGGISWQFDQEPTVVLTSATLRKAGGSLIPVTTHTPQIGDYFNMVTVVPTEPLAPGNMYTVEMHVTLGNRQLSRSWSFITFIQPDHAVFTPLVIRKH